MPTAINKHTGVTMVSWNVRGLGHHLKRAKVFAHLKSLSSDLMFLQETHIRPSEQTRLKCNWAGHVFQSTFSSKARGVAIIIKKNIPFQHINTISDINGRYLIVTGLLYSMHVTLVNIYGPNIDDAGFFRKTFDKISDLTSTNLIIAGDYNAILDRYLDRSSQRQMGPSNASVTLNGLISSFNLVDIWRLQHPTDREYSFFSKLHNSYSRIDFFLLDSKLLTNVIDCKYHNIVISDHAPTSLILDFKIPKREIAWKMRPSLIKDADFCSYLSKHLEEFLQTNDTKDTSDSNLWETFKVVMRGHVISYEAAQKKQRNLRLKEIDDTLTQLEVLYRQNSNNQTLQQIVTLKYEYNTILTKQVSDQMSLLRVRYFELGDKPHTLLARQLRGQQNSRAIHRVISTTGDTFTHPKAINECFSKYYQELYKTKAKGDVDNWLNDVCIPKLDDNSRETLNRPITINEIRDSIKSFTNGKAPGPDGFGAEFYNKFSEQISPLLWRMLSHSTEVKSLPSTLYMADIALILKPDRDDTKPASYRPISMLNQDCKIFTKILANRLNSCVESIVHMDQTGFIPNRYSFFNTRRVLDIMYYKFDKHSKHALLCLDAEKAFDQVEWGYLFGVMERFGLGDSFISWVQLAYNNPTASVITNQEKSSLIHLERGTRQGCPLSPLLFALAIEPLAISIRNNSLIRPISIGGEQHKISLYADDIAIFMSDPEQSVPHLLKLINYFGDVSGYTINWQKSVFVPLGTELDPVFLASLQFKTSNVVKYLGIQITKNPKLLFKYNFLERLNSLKKNIEKWRTLPLSLIGRINTIKMVSLPRFLYLFQNIPIHIQRSYFKQIDSIILPFIWGYKSHRISKQHLQKPKECGGLNLPCFLYYYWAANIRAMVYWQLTQDQRPPVKVPSWLVIEHSLISKTSLRAILFSSPRLLSSCKGEHFILFNCQKIWSQIRKFCEYPNTTVHAPVWHNHAFPPSFTDAVFREWNQKGIESIKDLYINKHLCSFDQLQKKYNLSKTHFFRFLQIRNYIRQNFVPFDSFPEENALTKILLGPPETRGLISLLVKFFLNKSAQPAMKFKQMWEEDLNIAINEDVWKQALSNIHNCSINARLQLIQFKVIHRLHYSKVKLHKFFPQTSPLCNRCKIANCTLAHQFWLCPVLQGFWGSIFQWYSLALKVTIVPDPRIALFGCSNVLESMDHGTRTVIAYGMVVAERCILKHWKSDLPPKFEAWLREFTGILHIEKLRYELAGKSQKFEVVWKRILDYLKV